MNILVKAEGNPVHVYSPTSTDDFQTKRIDFCPTSDNRTCILCNDQCLPGDNRCDSGQLCCDYKNCGYSCTPIP